MSNKELEVKYKLSLLLDDALKSLRSFKAEFSSLGSATAPTAPTAALNKGLDQTEARIKRVSDAEKAAAKEVTAAKKAAEAEQAAAAKAAAQQAMDAKRAQAAEEQRLAKATAAAQRVAAKEAADAQRAIQKQANIATNQARMLGPQLTDISVGLATGQSPFYVALQQGGQLIDIYGGAGKALQALMNVFTPARVLILGVAGALGTVAYQALQGALQSDALNKSLALTGNIAGVTAGTIDRSARSIGAAQQVSVGAVRTALLAAVETGTFLGSTLDSAGRAAVALSKLTGKSADEQIRDFEALGNGVADWAAKQNRAYNFLTAEEFKHVRSLEAAGREQEAMRLVLDKLTATMEQRAVPAIGLLERAWNAVKKVVGDTADAIKGIGRALTPEQALAAAQERLEMARRAAGDRPSIGPYGGPRKGGADMVAQREAEVTTLNRDMLRGSENAAALQAENALIKQEQKQFQDALAKTNEAGAARLLQQRNAALDAEQGALELAHAKGLLSEEQHSTDLNNIELRRLAAQQANVKRRIELAAAQKPGTSLETEAQKATLEQLNGELDAVRGRIAQAGAQGRAIVAAAALNESREQAQAWAQVWQQAFTQVRQFAAENAATDASRLTDPIARAEAEAQAKVAAIRQQVAELQRDLKLRLALTLDPAAKASIVRQLEALGREGSKAIENQTDAGKFASLRAQWSESTDALMLAERALDLQVQQGAITTQEAEQRKFEARDKALPQLRALLEALRALARTDAERNVIDGLLLDIEQLQDHTTDLTKTVRGSISSGFGQMFSDIATGAKTAGDAFKTFLGNVVRSALNVIGQRLGEQLANSLLPKGGGGGGDWLSKGIQFVASFFHTGGVVGTGGGRAMSASGLALATALAGAPRYHAGGISGMGLRSNEELAVLLKGEEVLTEDDPRHVQNLGRAGGRAVGGGVVVNSNVTITGAQGDGSALQRAGDDLDRRMTSAIDNWAVEHSRPGGILAERG